VAIRIGWSSVVDGRNHVSGDRVGRISAIIGAIFAGAPLSRLILSPSALLGLLKAFVLLRIQRVTRKSVLVESVVSGDRRS
jgi:hypothetical protein